MGGGEVVGQFRGPKTSRGSKVGKRRMPKVVGTLVGEGGLLDGMGWGGVGWSIQSGTYACCLWG